MAKAKTPKIPINDRPHVLYEISSHLTEKKYVGITWNAKDRWVAHKGYARRGGDKGWYIHRVMRKYGWDNFTLTVLHQFPNRPLAAAAEIEMIATGRYECNQTPGGDFCGNGGNLTPEGLASIKWHASQPRGPMPEHQKKAISEGNKGKKMPPMSEETRRKISESAKGKVRSEEFKENLSEYWTGKKKSPEAIKKAADSQRGVPKSPEHVEALRKGAANRKARKVTLQLFRIFGPKVRQPGFTMPEDLKQYR